MQFDKCHSSFPLLLESFVRNWKPQTFFYNTPIQEANKVKSKQLTEKVCVFSNTLDQTFVSFLVPLA